MVSPGGKEGGKCDEDEPCDHVGAWIIRNALTSIPAIRNQHQTGGSELPDLQFHLWLANIPTNISHASIAPSARASQRTYSTTTTPIHTSRRVIMSSPPPRRSVSRGRSRTPVRAPSAAEDAAAHVPSRPRSRSRSDGDEANGARRSRSHSPPRSCTPGGIPASRDRSYTHSRSRSRSPSVPRSAKIVIEKLTKNVHAAHLHEIFGTYGAIAELEMPLNHQFMTNKGIAYILYDSPTYAESAIAHMHEAQLDGALISVSVVLPRRRFSRSPPPRRPPPNRFGEPHRFREAPSERRMPAPDRAYGRPIPPPRASPPYRGGARWSPGSRYGGPGGRGGGYRDRYDDARSYRPRSVSPSRSPPPRRRRRRRRSDSSRSRSPSRSPPRGEGGGGGRRRRSPSYASFSDRSRSRDRGRGRR